MAGNTEKIDEIVDRSAVSGQITSTTAELRELEAALVDSLNGAVQLNQALGKAQTFRQYQQTATQAATATAKLAAEQQKAAIVAQKLAQEEAKTAIQNNNLALSNDRLRKSEENKAKAAEKAKSEYQKLVAQYNVATAAAREAGVVFGTQSEQFTEAAGRVNQLRSQLDAIDQPLGNFQRNVGNYANSVGSLFTKVYGYIKTAANIIPGLGISGIFLAAFEGIQFLAEKTGIFSSKAKNELTDLQKYTKEAADNVTGDLAKFETLYEASQNVNIPLEQRRKIVEQLQKDYPAYFANLSQEAILAGGAASAYENLTNALIQKAVISAGQKNLEEQLKPLIELRTELNRQQAAIDKENAERQRQNNGNPKLKITNANDGKGFRQFNGNQFTPNRIGPTGGDFIVNKDGDLQTINQYQKAITDKVKDANAAIQQAIQNFGINGLLDPDKNQPKKLKQKVDKSFDDRLAAIKAAEQEVLNSETASYQERFAAIDRFEKDTAIVVSQGVKAKVFRALDGQNKIKESENEAAKQRIAVQKQVNAAVDAQEKQALEQLKGNLAQEILAFQDAQNQKLLEIDKERSKRASALADQYAQGKISALQYNQQLYELDSAAAQERVKVQIAAAEATVKAQAAAVALGFGNAKDLQNSTNQLARLQIQASDLVTENELANIRKIEEARKRLAAKEKELADAAITVIQTVVDAGYTNQLNALQEQSDQIDSNADKEKKAIENSNLSQQEKADKTKLLDAQVQAQKELIAQKEKKIRQDQAKFDRAVAIARVIQATAIAVAEALTVPIVGIALASVIGALGAVQLATILATPLPKYAKGTMNSPEGYAHVGEQGVEGRIEPDGSFSLTPATDTITYLKKGTKIIPHMQLMKAMQGEKLVYVGGQSVDMTEVVKAIKDNKPQKQGNPRINGWARELRDMEKYNDYRKNYFN